MSCFYGKKMFKEVCCCLKKSDSWLRSGWRTTGQNEVTFWIENGRGLGILDNVLLPEPSHNLSHNPGVTAAFTSVTHTHARAWTKLEFARDPRDVVPYRSAKTPDFLVTGSNIVNLSPNLTDVPTFVSYVMGPLLPELHINFSKLPKKQAERVDFSNLWQVQWHNVAMYCQKTVLKLERYMTLRPEKINLFLVLLADGQRALCWSLFNRTVTGTCHQDTQNWLHNCWKQLLPLMILCA